MIFSLVFLYSAFIAVSLEEIVKLSQHLLGMLKAAYRIFQEMHQKSKMFINFWSGGTSETFWHEKQQQTLTPYINHFSSHLIFFAKWPWISVPKDFWIFIFDQLELAKLSDMKNNNKLWPPISTISGAIWYFWQNSRGFLYLIHYWIFIFDQ